MSAPIISISDVIVDLTSKENHFSLICPSLNIYMGDRISVLGRSGSGKTTLLRLIAGFLQASSGKINWGREGQKSIQMVFQGDKAVFPNLTVSENVTYGLEGSATHLEEIASNQLKLVGLSDWKDAWPKALSGGMRKRLELARCLAHDPSILLLDEAFSSLDIVTRAEILELLSGLQDLKGFSTLSITHNIDEAKLFGKRFILIKNGFVSEPNDIEFVDGDDERIYSVLNDLGSEKKP